MNSTPHVAAQQPGTQLAARLSALLRQVPRDPAPALLSITLAAGPRPCPAAPPELGEGELYWTHPEARLVALGRGIAWQRETAGENRLQQLARDWNRISSDWTHLDADACGREPALFVAFAFDGIDPMTDEWAPFPNAMVLLPELLEWQERGQRWQVFSCRPGRCDPVRQVARWTQLASGRQAHAAPGLRPVDAAPSRTPDDERWLTLTNAALRAIDGPLDKLVLYRRMALPTAPPQRLAERLASAYPDCRIFATARSGSTLISASPERLVAKRGRNLICDALAGTAPRGAAPELDRALGQALRSSAKDRREHDLVAAALRNALAPLCRTLQSEDEPSIRRLRNVQHLWRRLHGTLRADAGLLDIAERLHPTPAVGGSPGAQALRWLRRHGQARRGWYSGAAGWLDRAGDGELAVLLRCALIDERATHLYAGAGLVRGSQAEAELRETELKFRAVLDVMEDIGEFGADTPNP